MHMWEHTTYPVAVRHHSSLSLFPVTAPVTIRSVQILRMKPKNLTLSRLLWFR